MRELHAELGRLCDEAGLDCQVKVYARERVGEVPPGLDMIIAFRGEGTPPEPWTTFRVAIEGAMARRGLAVLPWLCWSGPLDGKPSHCVAVVT